MHTVEQIEALLRDRAQVYPGHPAAPFLRAVAEAFVEYAQESVAAEREACFALANGFADLPKGYVALNGEAAAAQAAREIAVAIRNRSN